jgi:hypothetical protein
MKIQDDGKIVDYVMIPDEQGEISPENMGV